MVTERRRDGPGLTEVLFYPFPPGKSPGDSLAHQAVPAGGKGALNTETQTRFDPSQLHDYKLCDLSQDSQALGALASSPLKCSE